ncbi:MAG: hypothetical protein ACLGHN_02380 [Bacteriovoracia bacterium]
MNLILWISTILFISITTKGPLAQETEEIRSDYDQTQDKRTQKEEQMEARNQNSSIIIESDKLPDFSRKKKEEEKATPSLEDQ